MLKRDRTGEEKHWDGMVKRGLMLLGENPSKPTTGQSSEVPEPHQPTNPFQHTLYWDRLGRKGQRCRLVNPNQKNSNVIEIEFEDGFIARVSRFAIRRSD